MQDNDKPEYEQRDDRSQLLRQERRDNEREHEHGQHAPEHFGRQQNCPLCEQDEDSESIPEPCEI